jgi:hypothetical protein
MGGHGADSGLGSGVNQINANKNDSHFMDEVREGQAKAGRSGWKKGKEKGSVIVVCGNASTRRCTLCDPGAMRGRLQSPAEAEPGIYPDFAG